MERKSCFFIGHRDAPDRLFPALVDEVELHIIKYGVVDFVVGGYGRFDILAARAVKVVKQHHPEITLTLLLPYHPSERSVSLPSGFDDSFYPPGMECVPKRAAIIRSNRYMVDHSDYLIAYVWKTASNARELVEYARKLERNGHIQVTMLKKVP